ncbi:MAG: putative DNA binding domain-containing protein [Anaerolineae bacterium]|nr:putative DNA binding domain-containing protein [Anaerolineae bacterium]MDH7474733.1 putative DNA binding domain-containing protein [Anaerolineae bacterium]
MTRKKDKKMHWWRMDLHVHTPASRDWEQPEVSYLDILRKAEERGLDIIAFTDHNTVAGYRAMLDEIEQLELLERLERLHSQEKDRLDEYRRLREKILILPGVEFTATFGFHILGIFSPETMVRELEHLLISLHIPPDKLDEGSTEIGASIDVLTAYHLLNEAGGIVIAAHANSSHGVAMRGLRGFAFSGQTRIAYTQDEHLHALEVTDLEKKGRRTTAAFYNGSKPEYPRRMRCIQASDAHRLDNHPKDKNRLGIGGRVTEVLLPELNFEALREVFLGTDFTRTRPARSETQPPFDYVAAARESGPSIVQSFHESMTQRGGRLYAIIADVVAMANTNGGTIYVGVNVNPKAPPVGVDNPEQAIAKLRTEIEQKVIPPLNVSIDVLQSGGKNVIRIEVPVGANPPYTIEGSKIYVRQETETNLAVRDEIVALVKRSLQIPEATPAAAPPSGPTDMAEPPKTGVEIVASEERQGKLYHTIRDLRNNSEVQNVTLSSSRRLWHYAISQHEQNPVDEKKVIWHGDLGLWQQRKTRGVVRYDLVQRLSDGSLRVYYGVSEDGIHGQWRAVVGEEENSD